MQEREIERLGGSRTIPVNVRALPPPTVICGKWLKIASFAASLLSPECLPTGIAAATRSSGDIPLLAKHFTQKMARHMNRELTQSRPRRYAS